VVLLILLRPGEAAVWDQTFIGYRLAQGYPHFEAGIVSHLIVGLVNAIVPYDPVASNAFIRALAALLYLGAAGLLAWSVTGPERLWGFVAFVLLLTTAGFPFLWLSSELFAGAFLMLLLWSVVRERSIAVTGLFLALFALSKADLALPGVLVGAWLALRPDPVPRWRRAAVLLGIAAALALPSLTAPSYYGQFGGRSWVSFGQHYGELVRNHQLEPAPDPWGGWPRYLERSFPGAGSVAEAALHHPRRYAHFVALSVAESALRLWPTRLFVLVPLAALLFLRMPGAWRTMVLLLLSMLVPIVLFAFLHARYQARLYPLALFVVFAGLRAGTTARSHERALAILLAALLVWQAAGSLPLLRTAYWLPD
jgi:hypothetical protein